RLAAALERGSEHPLAAAIVAGAEARGLPLSPAIGFASIPGQGVEGTVEGRRVVLGNRSMLAARNIDPGPLGAESRGALFVAIDGRAAGILAVADPIKPSAKEALRLLHADGLRIVMLTGDSRTTAEAVARELGIDEVIAEVLPDQKAAAISKLQAERRIVA